MEILFGIGLIIWFVAMHCYGILPIEIKDSRGFDWYTIFLGLTVILCISGIILQMII